MRRIVHLCWAIALAFSSVTTAAPGYTAPQYVFTDLGAVAGTGDSTAAAINNLGQVIVRTNGDRQSFVWTPDRPNSTAGRFWDMGVIQYENMSMEFGTVTVAYDINDKGEIVGISGSGSEYKGARDAEPFKTRVGTKLSAKCKLRSTDGGTAPYAINNRGVAVGACEGASTSHATKWPPNGLGVSLGKLHKGDWDCGANDINEHGTIVGSGGNHAWVLTGMHKRDLGEGSGMAVNNHGVVAGMSEKKACLWIGSKRQWLDKTRYRPDVCYDYWAYSSATDINDAGQVVGSLSVYLPADRDHTERYESRAALWSGGKTVNLNKIQGIPQGWTLESALAINNKGQIVGYGTSAANPSQNRAFLLTPVKMARKAQVPSR